MQLSVVYKTKIENDSFRVDAEFYKPEFIEIENKIKKKKWEPLKYFTKYIRSFGAYSLCNKIKYKEKGIPYLRCQDIKDGCIDFSNCLFIDDIANNLLWKSEIFPETVLLTMSGTVGYAAIATNNLKYPINSNQDIAKIILRKTLNPYFLTSYLNCYYGNNYLKRLPIGSIQQHIFLWQIEKIPIPLFNWNFQKAISEVYKMAIELNNKSSYSFQKTKTLLLHEIGFDNWQPKKTLSFIKNYSDTKKPERIDAEYFHPKHDETINIIKNYRNGFTALKNIVEIKDNNIQPKTNKRYKYIELADIGNSGEIIGFIEAKGVDLPTRARRMVKYKDLIVSSVEGSLDKIALIREEHDSSLCSTGFFVLHSDKIESEVLLVFLKTIGGFLQLKRGCKGTILTAISKDELNKIVIPCLNHRLQNKIKQIITKSFSLQNTSKTLLEIAKKGVEIAIEEDEIIAEKWMRSEIAKIEVNISI